MKHNGRIQSWFKSWRLAESQHLLPFTGDKLTSLDLMQVRCEGARRAVIHACWVTIENCLVSKHCAQTGLCSTPWRQASVCMEDVPLPPRSHRHRHPQLSDVMQLQTNASSDSEVMLQMHQPSHQPYEFSNVALMISFCYKGFCSLNS